MGMFDYVWVQNPKILYDEFNKLNIKNISYEDFSLLEWQTKDGENLLGYFKLHTDGRFTYGSHSNESEDYLILNRTFEIHAYDNNRNRYSCYLLFENGKLDSIDAVRIDVPRNDLLVKLNDHRKSVRENKLIWNKIKKIWNKFYE